ncbi:MAG: hypothetical protein ACK595_13730, partial [Planctomycetota bacterium]
MAPAVTTFLRSGVRLAQIAPPPPPALATVPGPVTPAAAAVASPIGQDRGGDDGEPATAPAANAPAAAAMSATAGPTAPSDDETTLVPSPLGALDRVVAAAEAELAAALAAADTAMSVGAD